MDTISFAGMLALFAFGNNPLNQQVASWGPGTLPANWREIRNAWDSFHAASSVLAALALTCLLIATLPDTSTSFVEMKGSQGVDHRKQRSESDPHQAGGLSHTIAATSPLRQSGKPLGKVH